MSLFQHNNVCIKGMLYALLQKRKQAWRTLSKVTRQECGCAGSQGDPLCHYNHDDKKNQPRLTLLADFFSIQNLSILHETFSFKQGIEILQTLPLCQVPYQLCIDLSSAKQAYETVAFIPFLHLRKQ